MTRQVETPGDSEWLAGLLEGITDELPSLSPSEWAEAKRYLPPSTAQFSGYYSFEVTPYLREILDCLDPRSPVRVVDVMKGVQMGATTGVIENAIGYVIDNERTKPMIMVTAKDDLAAMRIEQFILPMLYHSRLDHLIRSNDEKSTQKKGSKKGRLEWGGGYLIALGANSPVNARSLPVPIVLLDEVDAFPLRVGKDGDPVTLFESRANAFHAVRKIAAVSTPLEMGTSRIHARFLRGDQRRYFVPCLKCGTMQVLRWSGTDEKDGTVYGIKWDDDKTTGNTIPASVRYLCRNADCGHAHYERDKTRMLARGEWRPTATPKDPNRRSYHLPALLSPAGFATWESLVSLWKEAWDVEKNGPRDMQKLQVFYNNGLGEPFEIRGQKLSFRQVSDHRLREYTLGQVPSLFAEAFAGGPIRLLTCMVDVHGDQLIVMVFGWTKRRVCFLVDYWRFNGGAGSTGDLDNADTWGKLREVIDSKVYTADNGDVLRPVITFVDSNYQPHQVYDFCGQYAHGVYPIKGISAGRTRAKAFDLRPSESGIPFISISVDYYKDRWAASLRRSWDHTQEQPEWRLNLPGDLPDKVIKELTAETKREKVNDRTGQSAGWEWHRPSTTTPNELWDGCQYTAAALEKLAVDLSPEDDTGTTVIDWSAFARACDDGLFLSEG